MTVFPYSGTGSAVSKRAFAAYVSVSEKAQKNLGEYNKPIGKTISMHMLMP